MWKIYSRSYLKNNPRTVQIMVAGILLAAFFISLLCSLFYNLWAYDIQRIQLEEGDWQGRLTGKIDEKHMAVLQNHPNVEKATIHEALSDEETTVDLIFKKPATIYRDLPEIARELELSDKAIRYHDLLLSRYFIHNPEDDTPPMLLGFYALILLAVVLSLVLMIRSIFEWSMGSRMHQWGLLSCIGATPGQVKKALLQEVAVLTALSIPIGVALGIGATYFLITLTNSLLGTIEGRHPATLIFHPMVLVGLLTLILITVLFSAWMPAKKISKKSTMHALRGESRNAVHKKKNAWLLSRIFGIEGTLAGNALWVQRKSLRIAKWSLLLSFLGFTLMLCFFTLSGISTRYTYFERYQNSWDIMATVQNTPLQDFELTDAVKGIDGVRDVVLYQKTQVVTEVSEAQQSDAVATLGGLSTLIDEKKIAQDDIYRIPSPVFILDDESYRAYCAQLGIDAQLDGGILLNRIWDSANSHFRNKTYIPFIKETKTTTFIDDEGKSTVMTVQTTTDRVPLLREDYGNQNLVYFVPVSYWKTLEISDNQANQTTTIRVLATDRNQLDAFNKIENKLEALLGSRYSLKIENRIAEKIANDQMIKGSQIVLGGFCVLLAGIGLVNIYFNTLSFVHQRKREFARYFSMGLTPKQMKKIFRIEALVLAGKPLLWTFALTVPIVAFMITASQLEFHVFLSEAPFVPIILFASVLMGSVFLAYAIGGKRILRCNLNEALKKDTML